MTEAVRSIGARTLDTRLQDLTDVWESLANWEGPVRDDAPAVESLRAYTGSGASWPTRQSKSSPMIISSKALTAAAMQRYHLDAVARRELGLRGSEHSAKPRDQSQPLSATPDGGARRRPS